MPVRDMVSHDTQRKSAVLSRDKVQTGLSENGGEFREGVTM